MTRQRTQDQTRGENRQSECQIELQVRERKGEGGTDRGGGRETETEKEGERKAEAAATDQESVQVRRGLPALLTGPEDPRSVFSEHGRLLLPPQLTPCEGGTCWAWEANRGGQQYTEAEPQNGDRCSGEGSGPHQVSGGAIVQQEY